MLISWWRSLRGRRVRQTLSRRVRPALEQLEDRTVPAIITVTGAGDSIAVDGVVTLREALTAANTNAPVGDAPAGDAGLDVIQFDAPGTLLRIRPLSALPAATEPITIDGTTHDAFLGGASPRLPVEIDGRKAGAVVGLTLSGGDSIVRGLRIHSFAGSAIRLETNGNNQIVGNLIGGLNEDRQLFSRKGNVNGIDVFSDSNQIGGTTTEDRNVISANLGHGVNVVGNNNVIRGNRIGTTVDGVGKAGNSGDGVRVTGASSGNQISTNSIFANRGLGIDLGGDGVTWNDVADADTGPNGLLNFPVLQQVFVAANMLQITGAIRGLPSTTFSVELFVGSVSAGENAEGQTSLGAFDVTTDGTGLGQFLFTTDNQGVGNLVLTSEVVTATATAPNGSTSEFSPGLRVQSNSRLVLGSDAGQISFASAFAIPGLAPVKSFLPFGTTSDSGVRVAVGDVNSNGAPDYVFATGPGPASKLSIFSGDAGPKTKLAGLTPYGSNFTRGLFVAVGDVTGDGRTDVVVAPDAGAKAVIVYSWFNENGVGVLKKTASFFPFGQTFAGGVRVAVGDVNGDGRADIICAPGVGIEPRVRIFDGVSLNSIGEVLAYDPSFTQGGVFVAAADFNGDGRADLLVGPGETVLGALPVRVFDVQSNTQLQALTPYGPNFEGGVRVAAADVNQDGVPDILTTAGEGGGFLFGFDFETADQILNSDTALEQFVAAG